jgi:hypothetical protein
MSLSRVRLILVVVSNNLKIINKYKKLFVNTAFWNGLYTQQNARHNAVYKDIIVGKSQRCIRSNYVTL